MTIAEIKALDHVSVTEQNGMTAIKTDDGYYLKYDETRATKDGEAETASVFVAAIYTMDAETTTFPGYTIATEAQKLAYERKPDFEGMTLEEAKEKVLAEITAYDTSSEVNGFNVAGMTLWFSPEKRVAIEKGVRNCKAVGRESYEAWLEALGTTVSVPCDTALDWLAQIEVYALDCMNVTNKHKAAVNALTTVDEVAAYDYKSGYPSKLTFSLG